MNGCYGVAKWVLGYCCMVMVFWVVVRVLLSSYKGVLGVTKVLLDCCWGVLGGH